LDSVIAVLGRRGFAAVLTRPTPTWSNCNLTGSVAERIVNPVVNPIVNPLGIEGE
jgi:hypothetical protein